MWNTITGTSSLPLVSSWTRHKISSFFMKGHRMMSLTSLVQSSGIYNPAHSAPLHVLRKTGGHIQPSPVEMKEGYGCCLCRNGLDKFGYKNQFLLKSVQKADSEGVKKALIGGADVNYNPGWGSNEKTALHFASHKGHHDIVALLIEYKADVNSRDKYGATPLNYSYLNDHHAVCKTLEDAGGSLNYTRLILDASNKGKIEKVLECLGKGVDINYSDKDELTPLHIASSKGHHELVSILINKKADLERKEHTDHKTPLHLASKEGHYRTVVILVNNGANINAKDKRNNTPLHFAIQSKLAANVEMISFLLSNVKIQPALQNDENQTPMELIRPYDKNRTVILQLFSTFESCCIHFPVHTYSKVFLCGYTSVGKTSLTEVIKYRSDKSPDHQYDPLHEVTNVTLLTAGIEPHTITSHELGNIVLHDFAGHTEYYDSHAAVLEHLMLISPGVFLILLKLTNDKNTLEKELYFWTNYIENVSASLSKQSQIIVIGSHIDKVSTDNEKALAHLVEDVMKNSIRKQHYRGFVAMECHRPSGKGIDQFIPLLASSCKDIVDRSDSISYYNHVLYSFLKDMKRIAVTLNDLIDKLNEANHPSLPSDIASVTQFLSILSDKGLILYLPVPLSLTSSPANNGWIIIDKTALLKEINGVMFAPEAIQRVHHRMASNTGIIPFCAIAKAFPEYNPFMVVEFMKSMELCHEFKASLLNSISTNLQSPLSSDILSEDLLLFPSLIATESPAVMKNKPSFGWCLWCPNSHHALSNRFFKVLLLRLALQCLPLDAAGEFDDTNPAQKFNRCCTVWKNGIYWERKKIEIIAEVSEYNRCLTVLVSEKDSKRALKVTAFVLNEIRNLQSQLCPCKVNEYIISPTQLSSNIRTMPVSERCLIPLSAIAKVLLADKDIVYDKNDCEKFEKDKVVGILEPYLTIPPVVVEALLNNETGSLSQVHLDHLQLACADFLKKEKYLHSNDIPLLRKRIQQFSIFTGFNPLNVAHFSEPKLKEILHKPLPDLTKLKDTNTSVAPQPNLADLMDEVASEASDQWRNFGIQLRISVSRLNAIRSEQLNDCIGCFSAVFDEWKNAATPPYTWETIVNVLESKLIKRHDLAKTIRQKYKIL